MAVNILVTSSIVFKIKVFLEVVDSTKLRKITFVMIESGMALFAIQLTRFVVTNLPVESVPTNFLDCVIVIHQMFNVIIRS